MNINTFPSEFSMLFGELFIFLLVITIMSVGFGLIFGGKKGGEKVIAWEFRQLKKFIRWVLTTFFRTIGNIFYSLAKACGDKKKKATP